MSQAVIDMFEMIEVEQQQTDLRVIAARQRNAMAETIHQQGAVGQPRQGVMHGQIADTRFGLFTRLDVAQGALGQ